MTRHRLVLRPAAQEDVASSTEWYARERVELGIDFAMAIHSCLDRIAQEPESFRKVHRDLRRAFVGRFPYLVFFRIEKDEIIVVAVMHGARRPATWQRRR